MKEHVESFIAKLEEGISIGQKCIINKHPYEIRNIVVAGLGGSGIGGTIAAAVLDTELKVPVTVVKDYFLPGFANQHTLLLACSYSGNTEETLQTFDAAIKTGAKIICITTGGKLLELAKQHRCDAIIIPGGMPPRACFPYSFTQIFYALKGLDLISQSVVSELESTVSFLKSEENEIKKSAFVMASKLADKMPVIYSEAKFEGVCIRFRQQINENSKMLCWHAALPEMNHNELVGLVEPNENLAVIFIRNDSDYFRTQRRMEIVKEVASKVTPHVFEIWSKGNTLIEKAFYHILCGDWISVYLADIKKIDATEVRVIDFLKKELSAI